MAARYVPKTAADNDATFGGMPLGVVDNMIDIIAASEFVDEGGVTRDGSVGFVALSETSEVYRTILARRADQVFDKFMDEYKAAMGDDVVFMEDYDISSVHPTMSVAELIADWVTRLGLIVYPDEDTTEIYDEIAQYITTASGGPADGLYDWDENGHTSLLAISATIPDTINMLRHPEVYMRFASPWFVEYVMLPRMSTIWRNLLHGNQVDPATIPSYLLPEEELPTDLKGVVTIVAAIADRRILDIVFAGLPNNESRRKYGNDLLDETTLYDTIVPKPSDFFVGLNLTPNRFLRTIRSKKLGRFNTSMLTNTVNFAVGWWYKSDEWTCDDVMYVTEAVTYRYDLQAHQYSTIRQRIAANYYSYLFPGMTIRAIKAFLSAGCDKDYVAIRDTDTSYTRVMREALNS
jgi:hypothetical protein